MFQANVDEQLILEWTGHWSLEGVREYKRTSEKQKEQLSDLLNTQQNENVTSSSYSGPGQQAVLPACALQLDISQAHISF